MDRNEGAPAVLAVDDERNTREFLTFHLEREGYRAFTAENWEQAQEIAAREAPDLVLLDVYLPDGSGFDLCTKIKEDLSGDSPCVVLMSAWAGPSDMAEALLQGVDDYFFKPLDPGELIPRIQALLRSTMAERNLKRQARSFTRLLESIQDVVVYQDREHRILWANKATARFMNMSRSDLVGRFCYQFFGYQENPCPDCPIESVFQSGTASFGLKRTPDGRVWHLQGYPVWDENGECSGLVEIARNVTQEEEYKKELSRQKRLLEDLTANIPGAVFQYYFDGAGIGRLNFVSSGVKNLLGLDPQDIQEDPESILSVMHPEEQGRARNFLSKAFSYHTPWETIFRVQPRGGEKVTWIQASARPSPDEEGQILWNGVLMDITRLKEAESRLEHMALHDLLTGLGNRNLFMDKLDHLLAQARRYGHIVGLLYMDLNGFKKINDEYGHQAGDEVLQEVGKRLQENLRESDIPARIGGDEFAVILPQMKDRREADKVAEKLLQALASPFCLSQGVALNLAASVGISVFPDHGRGPDQLIYAADKAMYQAKECQEHRYVWAESRPGTD